MGIGESDEVESKPATLLDRIDIVHGDSKERRFIKSRLKRLNYDLVNGEFMLEAEREGYSNLHTAIKVYPCKVKDKILHIYLLRKYLNKKGLAARISLNNSNYFEFKDLRGYNIIISKKKPINRR